MTFIETEITFSFFSFCLPFQTSAFVASVKTNCSLITCEGIACFWPKSQCKQLGCLYKKMFTININQTTPKIFMYKSLPLLTHILAHKLYSSEKNESRFLFWFISFSLKFSFKEKQPLRKLPLHLHDNFGYWNSYYNVCININL